MSSSWGLFFGNREFKSCNFGVISLRKVDNVFVGAMLTRETSKEQNKKVKRKDQSDCKRREKKKREENSWFKKLENGKNRKFVIKRDF